MYKERSKEIYKYSNISMNKKARIDTYKTIYPVHIVVANKYVTLKDLQKLYTYYNDAELEETTMDPIATTSKCKRKSDGRYVMLVKFNGSNKIEGTNKRLDLINTICHESLHCLYDIYEFIYQNVNFEDCNEHAAYLIGYIAECIYKTLMNIDDKPKHKSNKHE